MRAKIIPAMVIALAGAVLVGWVIESPTLVQVRPEWAPMQVWTAIGFAVAGAACLVERWGGYLGGVLVALGGLVLVEYLTGATIPGFDTLWGEPWCVTNTSHPGRMAPPTALAFAALGLSFFAPRYRQQGLVLVVGLLGVVSLAAYQMGLRWYAWGMSTHMAAHTALCFCALAYYLLEVTGRD